MAAPEDHIALEKCKLTTENIDKLARRRIAGRLPDIEDKTPVAN